MINHDISWLIMTNHHPIGRGRRMYGITVTLKNERKNLLEHNRYGALALDVYSHRLEPWLHNDHL